MRVWVNFKKLREQLKFVEVLKFYGVEVENVKGQYQGACPLPCHTGRRTPTSFSANLDRGIFQCFGCGAKGNTLDFAGYMESVDNNDGNALHKVAVKLQKEFLPEGTGVRKDARAVKKSSTPEKKASNELVNPPLDFELKGLDSNHSSLQTLGLSDKTISYFGLGFCSRGFLKDRIAIPLHHKGQLIGYTGLATDRELLDVENPPYLFPIDRERKGVFLQFRKTMFLYNASRIEAPVSALVLVENIHSVWRVHQIGIPTVVGLMDTDFSPEQLKLLRLMIKPEGRILLAIEESDRSKRLVHNLLRELSAHCFIKQIALKDLKVSSI